MRPTHLGVILARVATAVSLLLITAVCSSLAQAQGLVYVDANDGFGNVADLNLSPSAGGPLSDALNSLEVLPTDDKWGYREFGAGGTIFQADPNENAAELIQTISGLTPGTSYDVYVSYWSATDANWGIRGGLSSNPGGNQFFDRVGGFTGGPPSAMAGVRAISAAWGTLPPDNADVGVFAEENRVMLLGALGSAVATSTGKIDVFIDDVALSEISSATGVRSWLDGVAYVESGSEIFLRATINRTTGEIAIINNTGVDFNIQSIIARSTAGGLDPTQWESIASGTNTTVSDPDWDVLVSSPTTLSEGESPVVDGANIGAAGVSLGNVWIPSPYQGVSIDVRLDAATLITLKTEYVGGPQIAFGDFNVDGVIDIAGDYQILLDNLHSSVSTLTRTQSHELGNMDGNSVIDLADFAAFRTAYDNYAGVPGAFTAALTAVPEPGTAGLVVLFGGIYFACQRRLRKARLQQPLKVSPANVSKACVATVILLSIVSSSGAIGADVTGWATTNGLAGFAGGSNLTNSPITTRADDDVIAGNFTGVTLAIGDIIELTGSVSVNGILGGNQFRFGLFDGQSPVQTGVGSGYSGFTVGAPSTTGGSGPLARANGSATHPFGSGQLTILTQSTGPAINVPANTELDFLLRVTRTGGNVDLFASLTNGSTYDVSWVANSTTPSPVNYHYDSAAFLFGANINGTQAVLTDIQVNVSQLQTLTLEVNSESGIARLVNNSDTAISFDAYEVLSNGGNGTSLDLSGWQNSNLDHQNYNALDGPDNGSTPGDSIGEGWDASTLSDSSLLSEVSLSRGLTLDPDGSLVVGKVFTAGMPQDLSFNFLAAGASGTTLGLVSYVTGGSLEGDFNGDGMVNLADYTVWRDNLGASDEMALATGSGNGGGIDSTDYTLWKSNFGSSNATGALATGPVSVPEPSTLLLCSLVGLCALAAQGTFRPQTALASFGRRSR